MHRGALGGTEPWVRVSYLRVNSLVLVGGKLGRCSWVGSAGAGEQWQAERWAGLLDKAHLLLGRLDLGKLL